jgi:hypothetical protein
MFSFRSDNSSKKANVSSNDLKSPEEEQISKDTIEILKVRDYLFVKFPVMMISPEEYEQSAEPSEFDISSSSFLPNSWWSIYEMKRSQSKSVVNDGTVDPSQMKLASLNQSVGRRMSKKKKITSFPYQLPNWYPNNSEELFEEISLLKTNAAVTAQIRSEDNNEEEYQQQELTDMKLFFYTLQSKYLKSFNLVDTRLKVEFHERLKDLQYSTQGFNDARVKKDVIDFNYLINTKLKDVGTVLFTGIVKVDYFPTKMSMDELSSKKTPPNSSYNSDMYSSSFSMSSSKLSPVSEDSRKINSMRQTTSNRISTRQDYSSAISTTHSELMSSRSLFLTADGVINTNVATLFQNLQLYQNIQEDIEELLVNFYSNPNFLNDSFTLWLIQSYFRNNYKPSSNSSATARGSNNLNDAEGIPTSPLPLMKANSSYENDGSASPLPPHISQMNSLNNLNTSQSNIGSANEKSKGSKASNLRYHNHNPESQTVYYYTPLKQFMVLSLSPLDNSLHLYCFDLLTNECNLHLTLHNKRIIKPTRSILHSFQVMDEYHNVYQFTFCDSNINPLGLNLSVNSNNFHEISKTQIISCLFIIYTLVEYIHNQRIAIAKREHKLQQKLLQRQSKMPMSPQEDSSVPFSSELSKFLYKPRMILILKEGFLQKKGWINIAYQWRYFVLTNDYKLRYFKDDGNYQNTSGYKGVIDLTMVDFDIHNPLNSIQSFDPKEITINMQKKKGRRWSLRSDNTQDILDWTSLLNALLFQYQDYLTQKSNNSSSSPSNVNSIKGVVSPFSPTSFSSPSKYSGYSSTPNSSSLLKASNLPGNNRDNSNNANNPLFMSFSDDEDEEDNEEENEDDE